ncbi:hypothetical protein [Streptomyces sp. NPDC060198]|uniref:hypothetical protein n=1 Tax=Streptomyces sp. NPDC060198 TaxID=3347070 RepID=UPI00365A6458
MIPSMAEGYAAERRSPRPGTLAAAWDDLVRTARGTAADGLVLGTCGNASVRVGDQHG